MSNLADDLRLALASSIAIMAEDAADSDGYTDRQIEIIQEYGPLVGIKLVIDTDKWGEPRYRLFPKPSERVTAIKIEIGQHEQEAAEDAQRRANFWIVLVLLVLVLIMVTAAAVALIVTRG